MHRFPGKCKKTLINYLKNRILKTDIYDTCYRTLRGKIANKPHFKGAYKPKHIRKTITSTYVDVFIGYQRHRCLLLLKSHDRKAVFKYGNMLCNMCYR